MQMSRQVHIIQIILLNSYRLKLTFDYFDIITLSAGHATVVPMASSMNSISEEVLQRDADGHFVFSTQTLIALGPKGTKWTSVFGSHEDTIPSATISPDPSTSNNLHFFFSLVLLTLCQVNHNNIDNRI